MKHKTYWYETQEWNEQEGIWKTVDKFGTFFSAFLNAKVKQRIVRITRTEQEFSRKT